MLIENDLFEGKRDKVKISIARLQQFKSEKGYVLAFSGGKDSIVLKALADMAKVKYIPIFHLTTVDPPELIYYIRKYHKDVIIKRPVMTMKQLIVMKMYPPTRIARYCCDYLKEGRGTDNSEEKDRIILLGVRWEESTKRKNRKMVEFCQRGKTRKFLNPIIDWTSQEIWEFIHKYKLPYCELYDKGWDRIGCVGCPMASNQVQELELYPKIKKMYQKAFDEMIIARKKKGLPSLYFEKDVMHWWTEESGGREIPDQTVMFE